MATKKPMKKPVKRVRRFQEGGEAADKMAGLAMSNKDAPMGFFERLRMGNIDQEGSEAYNRLGAGRAKMDQVMRRDEASEAAANRMVDDMNATRPAKGLAAFNQTMESVDAEAGDSARMAEMMARGLAEGEKIDGGRRAAAQSQIKELLTKKRPAARPSVKFNAAKDSQAANMALATPAAAAPAAAPAANSASAIPTAPSTPAPTDRERLPEVTGMSDLEKLIAGTGIAGGALGLATKGKKIYQAGKKALQGFRSAKDAVKKSSPSGVTGVMPSKYIYTGAKKGGVVKKMAHGGSVKSPVSTASKRGDGIALRGKTRGKIY